MDPNLTKPGATTPFQSGNQGASPAPANQALGSYTDSQAFPWTNNHPNPPAVMAGPPTVEASPPASPVINTSPTQTTPPPITSQMNPFFNNPVSSQAHEPVQPAAPQSQFYSPPVDMPHASTVINQTPAGGLPPPPINMDQPVSPGHSNKKFPLMMVTAGVLLIITGFSGSYLFFRMQGKASQKQILTPQITPPVKEEKIAPTLAPADETNPFDEKTYENPFSNESSYTNPFGENEEELNDSYQNPFEETE